MNKKTRMPGKNATTALRHKACIDRSMVRYERNELNKKGRLVMAIISGVVESPKGRAKTHQKSAVSAICWRIPPPAFRTPRRKGSAEVTVTTIRRNTAVAPRNPRKESRAIEEVDRKSTRLNSSH